VAFHYEIESEFKPIQPLAKRKMWPAGAKGLRIFRFRPNYSATFNLKAAAERF
jgi:hypothetical protein